MAFASLQGTGLIICPQVDTVCALTSLCRLARLGIDLSVSRLPSKLGTSRASGRRPLHNTKSKTKRGAGAACCAATREGGGPVEAFGTQTARPVEAFGTQKARLKAPLLTKSQGLPPTARGGGSRRGVDLGVSGF